MYEWGTRMRLKHYLNQGMTKAELSRQFGISRRTIHYWIETAQFDRDLAAGRTEYAPRSRPTHKLDRYKGIIEARLAEFPKLSAQRLFDEVQAAGYAGGYGRVRDHVRTVRPRQPVEAAVRFETPPGRQGQVDFGTFTLPWGRRHALLVVLGHSRRSPAARSTRFFTHVVAYHPTARDAHLNLGSELLSRNRLDEALAAYRIAERQRPDDCKPPYGAGLALHHLDRLDEAEAAYFRASELCPRYGAALTDFAKLRLDGGGPPTGGTRPCTPPPPRCWASIDIRSVHEDLRRWVAP